MRNYALITIRTISLWQLPEQFIYSIVVKYIDERPLNTVQCSLKIISKYFSVLGTNWYALCR